jgi:hypothetical protein
VHLIGIIQREVLGKLGGRGFAHIAAISTKLKVFWHNADTPSHQR